jgi:ABC-type polysaccharide/polyol phosphate transport system ATPase subunit
MAEGADGRDALIRFDDVGVKFHMHRSIWDLLHPGRRSRSGEFWAVRNLSFEVFDGETVGVIGRNGSGKSTLSMIAAQVYSPDEGSVSVAGRIQLLTVGLGFQPDLTGRENVFVSGSLLGLRRREIAARMPDIEAFAEIGGFIDEPVRTYSSGMRARLGFAIATVVRPEILILDELLATGDQAFKARAMERMRALHDVARAVLVVSHSMGQVRELCDRVLWLDHGRMVFEGTPDEVVPMYQEFSRRPEKYRAAHPAMFGPADADVSGLCRNDA